jgi:tetratricopeptide (TPR) repeat protein
LAHQDFPHRLVLASKTFWFYLGKAFAPFNLCLVYKSWEIDPRRLGAWISLLAILALFGVLLLYRKRSVRRLGVGLALFAVLLFPAMGFFDAQYLTMWQVSDHLQYLALIIPVSIFAICLFAIPWRGAAPVVGAAVVCGLGFMGHARASAFSREETLLLDTLQKNPAASAAHNDLGCLLAARRDYPQALAHFSAAVSANPGSADAHVNLAHLLAMQGQTAEAETHFVAALRIKPLHSEGHHRYAEMLARRGREKHALLHLRQAMAVAPSAEIQFELCALLYRLGDARGAIGEFQNFVRKEPRNAEALNNLAWLLATTADSGLRNGVKAVEFARRACALTGFQKAGMVGTLAAALAEAGDFNEAAEQAQKAISLAQSGGDQPFAATNIQLLKLYKDRKAWHATAANRGS